MKKILIIITIFILASLAIAIAAKNFAFKTTTIGPNVIIGEKLVKVEIADTAIKQMQGLSDRKSLKNDEGMLFIFQNKQIRSFWMKNMNFPLDIIWIDDGKIVKIDKDCPPKGDVPDITYSSLIPVNYVLEMNAGFSESNNVNIGDKIIINIK